MNVLAFFFAGLASPRLESLGASTKASPILQMQPWTAELAMRALLFAIGFSPIASISLSTFELLPLHISGPLIVGPAILLAIVIAATQPVWRRQIVTGFLIGVAAVALYDVTRLPFVAMGLWSDFIPKIGNYLFNSDDIHWGVGYVWRYIGNGGGMGLAFYVAIPLLRSHCRRLYLGMAYGAIIFACLLVTIYVSPSGTKYLFKPCLLSSVICIVGHLVFGGVLGMGAEIYPPKPFKYASALKGSLPNWTLKLLALEEGQLQLTADEGASNQSQGGCQKSS